MSSRLTNPAPSASLSSPPVRSPIGRWRGCRAWATRRERWRCPSLCSSRRTFRSPPHTPASTPPGPRPRRMSSRPSACSRTRSPCGSRIQSSGRPSRSSSCRPPGSAPIGTQPRSCTSAARDRRRSPVTCSRPSRTTAAGRRRRCGPRPGRRGPVEAPSRRSYSCAARWRRTPAIPIPRCSSSWDWRSSPRASPAPSSTWRRRLPPVGHPSCKGRSRGRSRRAAISPATPAVRSRRSARRSTPSHQGRVPRSRRSCCSATASRADPAPS